MTERILASLDAEQAVIGAVLLSGHGALEALSELRLQPEHFYYKSFGLVLESMLRIYDAGGSVDKLTVTEDMQRHNTLESAGGKVTVEAAAATPPLVGNVRDYARRVLVLAALRAEVKAAKRLVVANEMEDSKERDAALSELMDASDADADATSGPDELATLVREHIKSGGATTMPLPFPRLEDCLEGGWRPGEMTLLGGHSSHGKSALADQLAEYVVKHGSGAHAYINEMTKLQRACRMTARLSGVDSGRVTRGHLSSEEMQRVEAALEHVPFGVTDAGGWSAADIARDIRRSSHDFVVVDLLHEIDYTDRQMLDRNCRILARAAKQAGCHVLATVHLNENRVGKNGEAHRPPPALGDIRDSGSLKNIVDNVLFVWRYQDEASGLPLDDSWIYFSKVRNGRVGRARALFNGDQMRFEKHVKDEQRDAGAPDYRDEEWDD